MTKTRNKRNNRAKTKKRGGGFFGNAEPYELRDSNIGNSIPLVSGAASEQLVKNGPLLIGGIAAVILGFIFIPKALK
jgi:hypothetical protein